MNVSMQSDKNGGREKRAEDGQQKSIPVQKQNITLRVLGKPYPLTIDVRKEEVYRLAERQVNELASHIAGARAEGFTSQDCLALTALQFAIWHITLSQSRKVGDDDVEALNDIAKRISDYLNRPEL